MWVHNSNSNWTSLLDFIGRTKSQGWFGVTWVRSSVFPQRKVRLSFSAVQVLRFAEAVLSMLSKSALCSYDWNRLASLVGGRNHCFKVVDIVLCCIANYSSSLCCCVKPPLAGTESRNKDPEIWQDMREKDINTCWGYPINLLYGDSGKKNSLSLLLIKKTYWQVLCKSCPVEFASYFHYCHSLTFDQRPDYAFLKRLFRELFTRQGIPWSSSTMHGC